MKKTDEVINLPNGKTVSFGYVSRVAFGHEPVTLERLQQTRFWKECKEEKKRLIKVLQK